MRKITADAINAFINAKAFKRTNTEVIVEPNVTILILHGNPIAYKYNDPKGTLSITNRGYFTATTKERLNGIPGVRIQQKNWNWYLNSKLWDGSLVDVY